uniref:Uncharacterized protein n=1 Tax=Escherichia coli TaxID=562 RepID=A0A3G1T378_ECOLX|nr:hypothetical protein pHNSD133T1_119 [Escherichia coli]
MHPFLPNSVKHNEVEGVISHHAKIQTISPNSLRDMMTFRNI